MSTLARAAELCEGAPDFTPEERQRIREFKVPDKPPSLWFRRRPGQSCRDAARERNDYNALWLADLQRMERMHG